MQIWHIIRDQRFTSSYVNIGKFNELCNQKNIDTMGEASKLPLGASYTRQCDFLVLQNQIIFLELTVYVCKESGHLNLLRVGLGVSDLYDSY